uniref:Retrovirus-related Pol polyprotein from transposon TNT 1-94 n=1 Tax=Tanacetum cinerariifolium TaxID=118510 RepID=A0A6L2JXF6_TANCI|nr:hypothetical protein [Tanacetum cinerariifolium]
MNNQEQPTLFKAWRGILIPAKGPVTLGLTKVDPACLWSERFMNYLEEQTDGEAMINSIKNGDQPLPRVTQVSIAGPSSTEQPPLKDKSMWKAAALYEYETFKATKGELLLDPYIRYLQVINDLKKCDYSKDNYDKIVEKKDNEKRRDMSKVKCYNCKKEGHFAKDCKKAKVKDYEYYKTKILLAKKEKDKQVILVEDHAWMESSSDSDQEINANMVFIAQTEKVLSDSEASSSSADDKISEDLQDKYVVLKKQTTTFEMKNKELNEQLKVLIEKNDDLLAQTNVLKDQLQVKHVVIDTHVEYQEKYAKLETERYEYMIRYSAYFDNDKQHRKQIADQEVLYDKMSVQLVEFDKHVRDLKNTILERDFKISELEECLRNKDLEIEKCLERLNVCDNKLHKIGQTNQTVHMIMPSKDKMYNGRKGIGFENPSYFCKSKDLRPTLYDERVINLGYTLMFLTHSNEALEIEKFKRARENKIEFAYDYENLNASYVNEKINLSDDYFEEIINPYFEKIDSLFQQTSSLKLYVPTVILKKIIIDLEDEIVSLLEKEKENLKTIESLKLKDDETGVESSEKVVSKTENKSENYCQVIMKVCVSEDNPNVIAPGMFKLRVSQSVSQKSVTKTSCASNGVKNLDTLSGVRRPKLSGVMWMKKGSSNTVKADLSSINHLNLNKNVKRYSCKDLMLCNISHHRDTRSAHACNNARNAYCNSYDVDVNDLFVFDDVSLRQSHVSNMPFRKKPCASLNVPSRSKLNKSLPRIVRKWLPKLQPLAEPVAKWILKIIQICLWIIDSGCSKHMTGNRTLLTNFVEKFLGTVRFGNNDFTVFAGYGDVVIGSITIKKVYYVKGLGHNLFSVGQFCDKGLDVAFRKSTCFVRIEDGLDLLTGDHSSNLYTISLNKVASNSSACLLAKASSSQSWLWHQHLSHLNFATINNLMKNNLVQGLPKMKFEKIICVSLRYVLVVVDDYSQYTWVFFLHSKDEASEVIISFIKKTQVNIQLQVQRVRTDNGTEFKNKILAKLFDEAKAIATTCFTQNRTIIHKHFDKTPYELMNKRKPNIKFFHVFGCRCYLHNYYDDVEKCKAKGDIRVFVGYSKESAAFKIYNKQTRKIHESVNVNFDEISKMASKQFSLEPGLSNLNEIAKSLNPTVSQVSEASKKDLEDLFHNFYNEYFDSLKIMKCSTTNVETSNVEIPSNEEEVFHEKGIDYDGMFVPVTRIESICLFLAYAAHKDFTVFQMDVKTTFLNGILKEEVYVGQPLGFVSTQYPDHVYALDKALYGLKQVPRAWYNVLSQFLIDSGFQKGAIDTTLFIKKKGKNIMLI